MKGHFFTNVRKAVSAGIVAAVVISVIPNLPGTGETVLAEEEITKNQSNTYLGTSGLSNPEVPENEHSRWAGSYVYFGEYINLTGSGKIRFRVLQKDSTAYTSDKALFLDSEILAFWAPFDESQPYTWENSDIRNTLNTSFLMDSFSECERSAIATSTGTGNIEYAPGSFEEFYYGSPVSVDDKVFLLDAGDVTNEAYGYYADSGWKTDSEWKNGYSIGKNVTNRMKGKSFYCWYLRSVDAESDFYAGVVADDGTLYSDKVTSKYGIAPAINVDQKAIVFCSSIADYPNYFTLTLCDSNLNVSVPNDKKVTYSGRQVTVPYSITGTDAETATRVSVLILDKEYKAGNTNNATILYYDGLDGSFGTDSTGTFMLPSSLKLNEWNSAYYVYILAEDINGIVTTDYASTPVKLGVPVITATPTPTKKPTATPTPAGKKSTWSQESGKWYYYDKNGSKVTGWYQVGSWYLFDKNGVMLTGWQQDGGKWYYLGNGGAMRTGWVKLNGLWYYLDASGAMKTGWLKLGKVWYFFKADGSMAANEYCGGYWLNANGSWTYEAKASWYKNTSGWYYQDTAGWYAKNGTYKIDGKDYNFGRTGYCTNP